MSDRPSRTHPTLIRILDFGIVAACLLTISVWVTGGFREWLPWGRISVTSWHRTLLVAASLIAVRHLLQLRPSVLVRLTEAIGRLRRAPGVRQTLPITVTTRAMVLLVGMLAVAMIGFREDVRPPWRMHANEFLNLPARWDTGWYVGIAAEGYRWMPARTEVQQNIAFFPAYPMLMRYTSLFLGRELAWTGVAISWVAFGWALVYLFRFTRERFDEDVGGAAAMLLATYPFALFFSTAYTEALFLLCLVGACYHFERDELWRAGAWGLVAGLSRPNGCLLSVVLALIAVRPLWPPAHATRGEWSRVARRLAVAALPGIGMLLYSAYIYALTGHPLRWAMQNAAWGRVYRGFDSLVLDHAGVLGDAIFRFGSEATVDALQMAAVLFVLLAAWPVSRRVGLAYAVLILINVIPPLLMGGLLSMGRVTSVLFPAFIWLGMVVPAAHRTMWVVAFAMLQALCAAVFFTWRPLF
jgi:hypothetical protein